jgi:exopolysaccharide biosynthesis polyprenyl glycosylphosphotransferase
MGVGPQFAAPILAALLILAFLAFVSMLRAPALQGGLKRLAAQVRQPENLQRRDATTGGRADLSHVGTSAFAKRVERAKAAADSFSKRMFDLAAASALVVALAPLIAFTALLIKLESRGPILYRQHRIGFGGRTFEILKFRSMVVEAEKDGPVWAARNDARVTRVGRIIRKLRIDEIPQAINVIRGDMSFVGPRPERPFFVNLLSEQVAFYNTRHSVKPGITGWAQVKYKYGSSIDDAIEKLQYDLYYVKNHTLFLDLVILLQTVRVVVSGEGAH